MRHALPSALVLCLAVSLPAASQEKTVPPLPDPFAADVASPDAILHALYDVISGPAGRPRDWARFRALFAPGAVLVATGARDGKPVARPMSVDGYVERSGPFLLKEGFFERETHRSAKRYGAVLHAFSTYESRHTAEGEVFARGVNSVELYTDGSRWFLAAIVWAAETPDNPVPRGDL